MLDNPAKETVEFHWSYTPADFFDGKIERKCGDYSVEIDGGLITARMRAAFFKPGPDFQNALTEKLRSYFRLWQLERRKAFEILGPSVHHVHPGGARDITIVVNEVVCVSEVGCLNLISTDANGVVHDAGREHFEAMKKLAEARLRHASDPTVHRMLESFDRSISEPGQVLWRLYEVWEALAQAFGDKKDTARKTLGISSRRLEALANDGRLKQGRHSGQYVGPQRDATAAEVDEARKIAKEMIEKYLTYLDQQQKAE